MAKTRGDNETLDWLGEDVSKNMLSNYASEAQSNHTILYLCLLALTHVTGDIRLL